MAEPDLTARATSRYFLDEGHHHHTHASDQHSTYGTKIIPTTWREAVAVLDEIFGNPTDLPIAEHTGADSRARYELSQRIVERAKVEIDRG